MEKLNDMLTLAKFNSNWSINYRNLKWSAEYNVGLGYGVFDIDFTS